jgi:hypothetical protein
VEIGYLYLEMVYRCRYVIEFIVRASSMDKDYIIAIIGIGGTILGTVAGFLSTLIYERLKESAKLKSELQAAINEVLFVTLANDYPVALNKLRQVIVTNAHSIKSPGILNFYKRWLTEPVVAFGQRVANCYKPEEIEQMITDLEGIKL